MKPLVIYHDHCTDGFGAAYAAWRKFGDKAEYVAMSYGDEFKGRLAGREVYILDFSFPTEVMRSIIDRAKHVTWLDHHKTAFENWIGYYKPGDVYAEKNVKCTILLDDNHSGALIAWEHFHNDKVVPSLIKLISDRDLWQFKLHGSKELHLYLQMEKPWTFEKWTQFDTTLGGSCSAAVEMGEVLLRKMAAEVAGAAKKGRRCLLPTDTEMQAIGEWVNTTQNISEVGHALAKRSGGYGLVWYTPDGVNANVSLRSIGEYDVSKLAKQFGGGGHKNAAGFEIKLTKLLEFLR